MLEWSRKVDTSSALLTVGEVATLLRVSKSTINKWRLFGGGSRFIKVGAAVRYRTSDVDDWLSQQTRSSTSAAHMREGGHGG